MIQFIGRSKLMFVLIFGCVARSNAQSSNLYLELIFTKFDQSERVVTRLSGLEAEKFDVEKYIATHINDGELLIFGKSNTETESSKYRFDSEKVRGKNTDSFCEKASTKYEPFLGIVYSMMDDFSGVLIERVIENSPSHSASFFAGDVISYIDDNEIRSLCDLRKELANLQIGQVTEITCNGDEEGVKTELVVGQRKVNYISWEPCAKQTVNEALTDHLQEEREMEFSLFPNPSTGISHIRFQDTDIGVLHMNIFDLNGKKIYNDYDEDFEGLYKKEIDISDQASGIYLIEISINDRKFTKEFVLQRK